MIEFTTGNLFDSPAEALVNPVNTAGVMGKGLAKQFQKRFPEIMAPYRQACDAGEFRTGMIFTVQVSGKTRPKYVLNFPTKQHWRSNSKLEYIESGLEALVVEIENQCIESVAVPPLGCGLGGLEWDDVKPLIVNALAGIKNLVVYIFEPD